METVDAEKPKEHIIIDRQEAETFLEDTVNGLFEFWTLKAFDAPEGVDKDQFIEEGLALQLATTQLFLKEKGLLEEHKAFMEDMRILLTSEIEVS